MVRLQEELQALALREAEAVKSLTELQQQVKDLSDSWQVRPPSPPWPPGSLHILASTRVLCHVVRGPLSPWLGPLLDGSVPFVAARVGSHLCHLGPIVATSVP